jgi:predicted ATPase
MRGVPFCLRENCGKLLAVTSDLRSYQGILIVIRTIEIKGLRGIRQGKLMDLSPLVVLVGPNGSGKSTVIEGILMAVSPTTAEAIVEVIRRHEAGGSGPRWLLWKAGKAGPSEVTAITDKISRKCVLQLERGRPINQTNILFGVFLNQNQVADGWVLGMGNKYHSHRPDNFLPIEDVID